MPTPRYEEAWDRRVHIYMYLPPITIKGERVIENALHPPFCQKQDPRFFSNKSVEWEGEGGAKPLLIIITKRDRSNKMWVCFSQWENCAKLFQSHSKTYDYGKIFQYAAPPTLKVHLRIRHLVFHFPTAFSRDLDGWMTQKLWQAKNWHIHTSDSFLPHRSPLSWST